MPLPLTVVINKKGIDILPIWLQEGDEKTLKKHLQSL